MKKYESPLKNALMTALFWIVQCLGCGFAFCLMFAMMNDTGMTDSGNYISCRIFEVHPVCFSLGGAASVIVLAAGWLLLLRRTWPLGRHWRAGWTVLWIIQALFGLTLILCIYLVAFLFMAGDLFIILDPEWVQWYIVPYLLAAVIWFAVDCTILTRRAKNDNN